MIERTSEDVPAQRAIDEVRAELDALKDAHLGNETSRDAFLALAHTALFAASIAFVGDLAEHGAAEELWLLIVAWAASVVGLCSLTLSYSVTARYIRRRHDQIYASSADDPKAANALNSIALWSFPVALISTFLFAAINVIDMSKDRPPPPPPAPPVPITRGITPAPRAPTPNTGVVPAPRAPPPPPPPPPPPSKD